MTPVQQSPRPWQRVVSVGERPDVVIEIILQLGADAKRAEQCRKKKKDVQPVTLAQRLDSYYPDLLARGIQDLILERGRVVWHENESPRVT